MASCQAGWSRRWAALHPLGGLIGPGTAAVFVGLLVVVTGPHHHLVVDAPGRPVRVNDVAPPSG